AEPRNAEVLWLTNGDRVLGSFLGIGPEKVEFQPAAGRIEVARSGIIALGFDPSVVTYPKPAGRYLELTFTDGSRLGVADTRIAQGQVRGTSRFGVKIRAGLGSLA